MPESVACPTSTLLLHTELGAGATFRAAVAKHRNFTFLNPPTCSNHPKDFSKGQRLLRPIRYSLVAIVFVDRTPPVRVVLRHVRFARNSLIRETKSCLS